LVILSISDRPRKNEDKSYDTYVIAAPGFQCIACDKYSKDMTPSDTHSQLKIYTHVMDALAGSVDQSPGRSEREDPAERCKMM